MGFKRSLFVFSPAGCGVVHPLVCSLILEDFRAMLVGGSVFTGEIPPLSATHTPVFRVFPCSICQDKKGVLKILKNLYTKYIRKNLLKVSCFIACR